MNAILARLVKKELHLPETFFHRRPVVLTMELLAQTEIDKAISHSVNLTDFYPRTQLAR